MTEVFLIKIPGSFTTVQDRGRYEYMDRGVPVTGALDQFAFRVANLLVGNSPDAAVLEVTMLGPKIEILSESDIAVTGADMGMLINEKPAVAWKSQRVKRGDTVKLPQSKSGCRSYLAVSGGIDVPVVMGSRSTYVKGGLGGFEGRPLVKNDILRRRESSLLKKGRQLPDKWIPRYSDEICLRAIPGPQDWAFSRGLDTFFSSTYEVTLKADRMGCRLKGPAIHHDEGFPQSIISEASIPGNIQIPADGQPIILLVGQTAGGYTKIATVISADISKVAQAVPGNAVRFERIDLPRAQEIYLSNEKKLHAIARYFGD